MEKHLDTAVRAAIAAGEAIMQVYEDPGTDWEVERKADNSPLTLADRRSHEVIMRHLAATPWPVLSEEGAHAPYAEREAWPVLWIVDPLDGTKEFLKRNGEFTVNIALVENGRPVAGVIYVPVSRTLYVGNTAGGPGAVKVERVPEGTYALADMAERAVPVQPAVAQEGGRCVVVASRSHLSAETEAFVDSLRGRYAGVELRSAGSSLKICLVAEGAAHVYPRFAPTMEWDTAAGHAIACAAGCEVVDAATERPLAYNKPDLHNPWFIVRPR